MTVAFANTEWGKSHLRYRPSLTDTQHAITVYIIRRECTTKCIKRYLILIAGKTDWLTIKRPKTTRIFGVNE
ncbi:hypothetical protein [Enterovibrio norvegicus]|uniref:hypothetical protein n=1 Tax=Enterovibrio norvegicus TaxID=188144 RepID=UPI001113B5BD|nr:hypothetical protein [Enterovibrio norvegicus]